MVQCWAHIPTLVGSIPAPATKFINKEKITMSARYDEMYPHTTHLEGKIRLLLVMKGYNRHNIHFRNSMGTDKRYLRNAYWEGIDNNDINYVQEHTKCKLEEWSVYDEDCGYLFAYNIIEGGQND